jgi:hypothetical protein
LQIVGWYVWAIDTLVLDAIIICEYFIQNMCKCGLNEPSSPIDIHYVNSHIIWNGIFKPLMTLEWDDILYS